MAAKTDQMPEASTAANIDVSLRISLAQMLDLALGAPEVGAVNFNILHNFLYVLLHQVNLQAINVEYRGENANRIKRIVTSLKPSPAFPEYDATDKVLLQKDGTDVDIFKEEILKVTNDVGQQDFQKVPMVVGGIPSVSAFKELEQSVKQLQQQYQALEDLSTSSEIVEGLKERIADPKADLWQFININKRLDTNEQGIDKLTATVQDMIKGEADVAISTDTSLIKTKLDELEDKISKMEQWLIHLQTITDILTEDLIAPTDVKAEVKSEMEDSETTEPAAIEDAIIPTREKEERTKEISTAAADKIRKAKVADKLVPTAFMDGTAIAEIRQDVTALKTDVARIKQELQDLNERVSSVVDAPTVKERPVFDKSIKVPQEIVSAPSVQDKPVEEPIEDKEKITDVNEIAKLNQYVEAVKNIETTHGKALHDVTQRVVVLETEIGHLLEKVDSTQKAEKTDKADITNLVTKVQNIEMDMEKIEQVMATLLNDKEKQETHINTLLEQIEFLKTVKASKEDLEDALADKADTQTVNRKVSHDQFDAVCDDLAHGLEEAIDKLTKQESIWQQALDEVQSEIATKVDKIEMMPLKDFVNNKLKSLQEKLKIMTEARREIEAAGTKKLLRDVQCISCDKDVVMKTEEVARFRADSLPCTTSVKPYLTYKLDQIRKCQKRLPYGRNMIQFEAAVQAEIKKIKAKEEMLAKTPRDHLSNRYCGGSHTITTPQQRVMRTGYFLTQWGPETIQLTDGLIKGKDGQMYRSRPTSGKPDVCRPACWESQISEEIVPSESASTVPKSLSTRRNSAGNSD